MKMIRLIVMSLVLIWPPLSGAVAAGLGYTAAHHHCDNVWHGHDGGIVAVGAEFADCGLGTDGDVFNCHDCGLMFIAMAVTTVDIGEPGRPTFRTAHGAPSRPTPRPSYLRPPIL
ncbi:MAG: hypothetical protein KDE14_10065 [Rhodobacteraceae bacterium]|nr:hypothetical protein [Paracoccaceae bacterium]